MKYKWIFVLAFFCFLTTSAFSQVEFYLGSFNELKREAQKKNKPFFIVFTADWCQPCKKMEREVFLDNEVGKFANTHYYALKVDGEKGYGVKIAKENFITVYPTIIIYDKDGVESKRISGYREKSNFLDDLRNHKPGAVKTKFSEFR